MSEPFIHKKSLGQNFLNSDYVPKKMCDALPLSIGETVLEIGPGTGALTKELLARGMFVIAIETDERAVVILQETFAEEIKRGQLTLHQLDARSIPLTALGLQDGKYAVVANIPYYLSGLLFRQLLETDCQPHSLVFLVQKEVAVRIARDKKESLLSLSVKAFGNPTYICTISSSHFTPPPKIDSAILAISGINRAHFETFSQKDFFILLHLGFGQKRKQLLGNLSASYSRDELSKLFTDLGLTQTVRAEDIPLKTWLAMAAQLLTSK
jgi:16S rRNA (adenine1518-N6/adenine1519-N6)-dimethyltransferase